MTPDQILLVQTSFQMVGADGMALATTLQARLPGEAPVLRRLRSAAPPAEQARQLAAMLVLAVRGLSRSRALRPALRRLGARHGADGLAEGELATFGRALLEAVEERLGATLPCAVRDAWAAGYRMQADLVIQGARTA